MFARLKISTPSITLVSRRLTMPKRIKGTILEKWALYWKNLVIDYREMLRDVRTDIQDNPYKSILWVTGFSSAYLFASTNPSEIDFTDSLRSYTNDAILVSEECLKETSIEHLRKVQQCYNEGRVRYISLGLLSLMYTVEYSPKCDLYKTQCSYLSPSIWTLHKRVLDVGFLGHWWNLFIKTTDYDINPKNY